MIQNKAPSPGSIARPFSDIDSKRPENVLWLEDDVDVITRAVVDRVLRELYSRARDSSENYGNPSCSPKNMGTTPTTATTDPSTARNVTLSPFIKYPRGSE